MKIGLLYWPKGGNVERVANRIYKEFETDNIEMFDTASIKPADLKKYDFLIVGGSTVGSETWEDADDSNAWYSFFKDLNKTDLSGLTVLLFGLGDQILYPDQFVDEMATLREEFERSGAVIKGNWPIEGYEFNESRSIENGEFIGLVLDEDQQPELTDSRIHQWATVVKNRYIFPEEHEKV
ncbi:MAG: flavodoxin [Bacteroidales bacterium]|nr:flavodoxin [Bacteroidales bacterium]